MAGLDALLTGGTEPLRVAVAAHEVGHGLAWRAAGFPAGPATVSTGLLGAVAGGSCPHGARGRVTVDNIDGFLVGLAAGRAAQRRCARIYLGGWHGRAGGCAHDQDEFRYLQRRWRTGLSWSAAERRAAVLLAGRARVLDELTERLAVRGRVAL